VPSSWHAAGDPLSDKNVLFSLTLFLPMTSAADVAAPITHLISVEVIEGLVSTSRKWTTVSVMWIEAIINVGVEIVGAMEPRAGSDKTPALNHSSPYYPYGAQLYGA
jgi:hypothetical protein